MNETSTCSLSWSRWYEGTLVHRLVHRMRTIGGLRDILKRDLSNGKLYQSMLSVVHRSQTAVRKTKGTLDNMQQLRGAEMKSFIRAQDDVSLDDLSLDDVVKVKTRYKTKERNNRCKNPELNRKEESRGWDLL